MERSVKHLIQALDTRDGAGVRLKRSLGQSPHSRLDPFLMLDEFASDSASDYIAGFPNHPHRGFETVTYMLEGHMLHEDHMGNRGDLRSGDVQWMTAGRGIIHSEMPQQESGRMHGFQLWINLPAREKMKAASYRDIPAAHMPWIELAGGVRAKVIAGELHTADAPEAVQHGPIQGLSTQPLYVDLRLPTHAAQTLRLPAEHNALVYVYQGTLWMGGIKVDGGQAAVLTAGTQLTLRSGAEPAQALVLAGRPLGEPVVQYGPFVMNTVEEINQALQDYRDGRLAG